LKEADAGIFEGLHPNNFTPEQDNFWERMLQDHKFTGHLGESIN